MAEGGEGDGFEDLPEGGRVEQGVRDQLLLLDKPDEHEAGDDPKIVKIFRLWAWMQRSPSLGSGFNKLMQFLRPDIYRRVSFFPASCPERVSSSRSST